MESHQPSNQHLNQFTFLEQNRYDVEENAVFIDFSQEALLSSIASFKDLNIYQRTAFAKNIPSLKDALLSHPQKFQIFLALLAQDCEANQNELLAFLRDEWQKSATQMAQRKELIEPLFALVEGAHLEVVEKGCSLLVQLAHGLTVEERQPIANFASRLLARQEDDLKIAGLQLTAKMATFQSKKEAEHCFTSILRPLYDSATLRIKKQLISICAQLGKHVSQPFFSQEMVRHFLAERCKEPMMGIRKSCAEVMPELVRLTATEKDILSTLILGLTKDGHKVVRLTACKSIPQFLVKHQGQHIPSQLLDFYINLPDHEINKIVNRENQIIYPVAFYFTAVLQYVGAAEWPRMSHLFNKLLFYKHDEITLPLASSLHEIAKVIGPELSREYLFPAFNNIFHQNSDELQLVALGNFSRFASIFSNEMRENLIDVFMVLQKNPKKWRIRYEIAKQLSILSQNYEAETLFRYILPISLKLANDPVSYIREETARHMHEVIAGMSKDPAYENIAEESLKGFGLSMQYIQRETFARMVATLHLLHDFREKYYNIVLELASDPIIVVRLALAISIKEILRDYPKKKQIFAAILTTLRKDEEVRDIFD